MARDTTDFRPIEKVDELVAYLAAGNLEIVGTNASDAVEVRHVTVNSISKIRVNHNGTIQDFNASSVTGKVRFWGYACNDLSAGA